MLVFLYTDILKVFHSHNNEHFCKDNVCCNLKKDEHDNKKSDDKCEICKFDKYYFEKTPDFYEYSKEIFIRNYFISYESSLQENYLLDNKLLRSPPVI